MERDERKRPRARRSFTPEFKAEIVELCQQGDRSKRPMSPMWPRSLAATTTPRPWIWVRVLSVAASAEDTIYHQLYDLWWPDAPHRTLRNKTLQE